MHVTENHLISTARYSPTEQMSGTCTPKFIVMHFTCAMDSRSVVQWFTTGGKSSAHLILDLDGSLIQMVPFDKKAWHAGPSYYQGYSDLNANGIGIEIINYGECNSLTADGKFVVPRRDESLPQKFRGVDDWLVVPDDAGRKQWWMKYTEAQFATLDQLVPVLIDHYKIRGVCGHSDVAVPKGRKNDPGPAFPMAHYKGFAEHGNGGSMGFYVATVGDLNVRGGPGAEFAILMKLNRGDTVKVLNQEGKWMLVQVDTTKGYVHSGFLMKT